MNNFWKALFLISILGALFHSTILIVVIGSMLLGYFIPRKQEPGFKAEKTKEKLIADLFSTGLELFLLFSVIYIIKYKFLDFSSACEAILGILIFSVSLYAGALSRLGQPE
jgi:hypothetical protein